VCERERERERERTTLLNAIRCPSRSVYERDRQTEREREGGRERTTLVESDTVSITLSVSKDAVTIKEHRI